jgi:hypothetical protein
VDPRAPVLLNTIELSLEKLDPLDFLPQPVTRLLPGEPAPTSLTVYS